MAKGILEDVLGLLTQADKRHGFPTGTMQSILQQETGGNPEYLNNPSKYHYAADAKGQRVAAHTGKTSTAFGPFGILESTGAKPGYGVAPLKDKSLEEQIRFASDYLAGRVKQAGSLHAGLAGYGEGKEYADKVVSRLPGSALSAPDNQVPVPEQLRRIQAATSATAGESLPVVPVLSKLELTHGDGLEAALAKAPQAFGGGAKGNQAADNPWATLQKLVPVVSTVRPADLEYGSQAVAALGKNPNIAVFNGKFKPF